jgi:hypothetical protein
MLPVPGADESGFLNPSRSAHRSTNPSARGHRRQNAVGMAISNGSRPLLYGPQGNVRRGAPPSPAPGRPGADPRRIPRVPPRQLGAGVACLKSIVVRQVGVLLGFDQAHRFRPAFSAKCSRYVSSVQI